MGQSSIASLVARVKNREITAVELVKESLKKAHETEEYNVFISLNKNRALSRAAEIDAQILEGKASGRLAGVPFLAKDNFLTLEGPTTAASTFLKDFHAPLQATAIEKLEAEGAICIGKANLDAFAHGGSTENSAYGPTKNAHNLTHVAGGSSGGSAVGVALDIAPFALGTDTGGSIRQPASFNGVVGVKPTYGTVSRFGVVAMASSTDTIGPIARSAGDARMVLEVIAGQDDKDGTSLPDFFKPEALQKTSQKIAVVKEFLEEGVDEEVKTVLQSYIEKLKIQGHTVEEVSLPILKYALAMYYIIVPAEISSNTARYDGVRYGHRATASSLEEMYGKSRDSGFEAENERRILIGNYVLTSGYYDAYYNKAQKARTLLINAFNEAFRTYDMLIGPVAPTPAFKLGEKTQDPVKMYLADVMTVPASLAGLPAISIPAVVSEKRLPIGVQLIGPQKSDAQLLALVESMEEIYG